MNRWLVLERDGVINTRKDNGILEFADWQPLDGSLEAIAKLSRAGYKLVIAMNVSAVGRGLITEQALKDVHEKMLEQIQLAGGKIQGVFFCPHLPEQHCDCRKPRTGLLERIEQTFGIELEGCYCVGDSLRDIQMAKAKGCKAVLVRTGNGTQTETTTLVWPRYGKDTTVFDDLNAFADHLLQG